MFCRTNFLWKKLFFLDLDFAMYEFVPLPLPPFYEFATPLEQLYKHVFAYEKSWAK